MSRTDHYKLYRERLLAKIAILMSITGLPFEICEYILQINSPKPGMLNIDNGAAYSKHQSTNLKDASIEWVGGLLYLYGTSWLDGERSVYIYNAGYYTWNDLVVLNEDLGEKSDNELWLDHWGASTNWEGVSYDIRM